MSDQIRFSGDGNIWGSPLLFRLVLSSDHFTGATGKSPTVEISKNGGPFASPAGAVSEVGHGLYKIAEDAADRNTTGPLRIFATAAACDESMTDYEVVGYSLTETSSVEVWSAPVTDNILDDSFGQVFFRSLYHWHPTPPLSIKGVKNGPDGWDSIVIESGVNARQAQSICFAFAAGQTSGAGSGTTTIKNPAGTATRIVATTPGDGNRTSMSISPPL